MMKRILPFFLTTIALASSALAQTKPFTPWTHGKKIINYGQDWPNTAYVRAHISEMEERPYDGIVIAVSKEREPKAPSDSIGFHAFSKERFDIKDFQHAIDDLRATRFKKFTDNFIQVEAMPGDVNFFDDEGFANIANTFKTLAHIAKQGNCAGLEFDPEEYSDHHVWTYSAWPEDVQKAHTEGEYIAKARRRGGQIMRAINSEFPNIKILCLFGPSFTYSHVINNSHRYRLLAPFIEGMCSVATEGTQIIDGYEQSYPYRTPLAFEHGREVQLGSRELFADKQAFDRVMRVGFGLWMDENSGKFGWHPDDPKKNHFQPDTWQTAVHYALAYSDEYVWTWHERFNVWTGKNANFDYLKAQEAAREKPGRLVSEAPPEPNRTPHAAEVEGHDDDSTFADLAQSHTLLYDLPHTGWLLEFDPTNKGVEERWFAPEHSTAGAKPIEIGKFWEEQGYDYDGVAWYRTTFKLDQIPQGKMTLSIGAADETARVWINGEQVADHDIGEGGWNKRIDADVTSALHPGENQITIRVIDRVGPGGLWKSIKLFSDQQPSSRSSGRGAVRADGDATQSSSKKIIAYGADWPNTAYVRAHIADMEKLPFDGTIIGISKSRAPEVHKETIGIRLFNTDAIDAADYDNAINDLRNTQFKKFTDNFLQIETMPGDVDFFDDARWSLICDKAKAFARVAKRGNITGLMIDPEEYDDDHIWTPSKWKPMRRHDKNDAQLIAQAISRGEQFMRAINSEYPNLKILFLLGPSYTHAEVLHDHDHYLLLGYFIEGMCRAATPGTTITDGYEQSYGYRINLAFDDGLAAMRASRDLFADKQAFNRVMRAGFGLCLDEDAGQAGTFATDPASVQRRLPYKQSAVYEALRHTDEYVWTWHGNFNGWEGTYPADQVQAYRDGRIAPSKITYEKLPPDAPHVKLAPKTADQPGHDDAHTFLKVLYGHDVLLDFPKDNWRFKLDPDNVGTKSKWFSPTLADSDWSPIQIGKFWEEQGWDYDGIAWYRTTFHLDSILPNRNILLAIGAADENATVYLNGKKVGAQNEGPFGWDKCFTVNVTNALKVGDNQLAIKVLDRNGPGGLWKSIKLIADRIPSEATSAPSAPARMQPPTTPKKLIEYGWDCPDPYYIQSHLAQIDSQPFNGIVIRPTYPPDPSGKRVPSIGRHVFSKTEFQPSDYQHDIDTLNKIHFKNLGDNFMQLVTGGDINWFDDAGWSAIAHNAGVIAKVAHDTHCVGIMLDPEEYGSLKTFSYGNFPDDWKKSHTQAEYEAKVRQRGQEFIRAINKEFPHIKILSLFGPSFTNLYKSIDKPDYSLLAPFMEGICTGADEGTILIDGYEQSYRYQTLDEFKDARREILSARDLFQDKNAFDRVMRVGFGLWLDFDSGKKGWSATDFARNHFQPLNWKTALENAMKESDEYVWVYVERVNWWTHEKLPDEYVKAQREALEHR